MDDRYCYGSVSNAVSVSLKLRRVYMDGIHVVIGDLANMKTFGFTVLTNGLPF